MYHYPVFRLEVQEISLNFLCGQKKIVEKIISKKADYTIGLKQNQPMLYQDTEDYFNEYGSTLPSKITHEKNHGRIEKREYRLLTDISWLEQKDEWKGLKALGMAKSKITENNEIREYTRYFITLIASAVTISPLISIKSSNSGTATISFVFSSTVSSPNVI